MAGVAKEKEALRHFAHNLRHEPDFGLFELAVTH